MSNSNLTYLNKVTRLEIIDYTICTICNGVGRISIETVAGGFECPSCHGSGVNGRQVIFHNPNKIIEASLQDDERTLKIFINERTAE